MKLTKLAFSALVLLALPAFGQNTDSWLAKTTKPLILYVSTTGNDANSCATPSKACRSVNGAIARVPRTVLHRVQISVGAGNFDAFRIAGFQVDASNSAHIRVTGTMGTPAGLAGLMSGTATSATLGSGVTFGTLGDTGGGWTTDQLRGYFVLITSGPGVGSARPIVSNTATAITVAGTWSTYEVQSGSGAVATGSVYAIVEPSTVINTVSVNTTTFGPPFSNFLPSFTTGTTQGRSYSIYSGGNFSPYNVESAPVVIEQLKIVDPTNPPAGTFYDGVAFGPGNTVLRRMKYVTLNRSYTHEITGPGVGFKIQDSSINSTGAGAAKQFIQANYAPTYASIANVVTDNLGVFWSGPMGPEALLQNNSMKNGGSGVLTDQASRLYFATNQMDTFTGACLSVAGGVTAFTSLNITSGSFLATNSTFANCAGGAIKVAGPVLGMLTGTLTGTSNGASGITISEGARVKGNASVSVTGVVDITIDAATTSYATVRGLTPKLTKDANYLTTYYE